MANPGHQLEPVSFAASRARAGFSLAQVAMEFGVPPESVSSWEEGNTKPPAHISRSLELIGQFATVSAPEPGERPTTRLKHSAKPKPTKAVRERKPKPAADAKKVSELVKSRQRVADHGEVFTPEWLVEKMLDLVKSESERIDSRFLEPACGSGNFLVQVLKRKLATVELKFGASEFERRNYALLGLTCIYGIELLADNIAECRANMLAVFAEYLSLDEADDLYRAASNILDVNLVHGDALSMRTYMGDPITFAEWGYLGKGKFQRRDFRLDVLTGASSFAETDTLFAHLGKHEIFVPIRTWPPMTVGDLCAGDDGAPETVE